MTKFTKADVGCYFDGIRGYADQGLAIQRTAIHHGMENFEFVSNPDREFFEDAVDSAIEYLNTLVDDDSLIWEFNNGDFGLYVIEESL